MKKALLSEIPRETLAGKTVVVRADFNVPLEGDRITDETRIRETLPTLRLLRDGGARVVLLSHLGRPKGTPDPRFSLRPVARRLEELLETKVRFLSSPRGEDAVESLRTFEAGEVVLLENTRFLPGEEANDEAEARGWGALADLYVNDAFGAAHRAHASTEGIARVVREKGGKAVAGLLMERELHFLGEILAHPERPFVALLGGAKISGKIDVIEAILPRVDRLLVGGAMANTFLRALGYPVGASLVEEDRVEMARDLLARGGDRILLPVDGIVADEIDAGATVRTADRGEVREGDRIGDIGPESIRLFASEIASARTVLWNGPMGVFELPPFAEGTLSLARALAEAAEGGATVVVGGGDSVAAAAAAEVAESMTHISTGGGASLEFLAGSALPGVEALSDGERHRA